MYIFFTTDLYCVKKSEPSVKIFIGHIDLCDNIIVASASTLASRLDLELFDTQAQNCIHRSYEHVNDADEETSLTNESRYQTTSH